MRADASSARGTESKIFRSSQTTSGSRNAVFTRISPNTVSFRPRFTKISSTGMPRTISGTICVKTMIPRKSRRPGTCSRARGYAARAPITSVTAVAPSEISRLLRMEPCQPLSRSSPARWSKSGMMLSVSGRPVTLPSG